MPSGRPRSSDWRRRWPGSAEVARADSPGAPAGRGRDLVNGPIGRTLILFALPTLGSNILQSLNGSINAIWIGRFLGEEALAATSNANLIMFLMFSAIFGFGLAATILVGQSFGRRDIDAARRALGTAIGLFLVTSLIISIGGWLLTGPLLRLLATPAGALPLAMDYLRVIFVAMPGVFLLLILTMGLSGTGDSVTPLLVMIATVLLDAGLNPVFILGLGPAPRLGIAGSALATVIANGAALIGLVAWIYARDLPIRLRGRELRYLLPDPALLRVIIAKGVPLGLQMIVISLSSLALIGLVNRYGVAVTAAYGVTLQLWTYIQMPAIAVGAAVSAMAAQNIGAGRWDRIGRITRSGIIVNLVMTATLIALMTALDRVALGLFLAPDSRSLPIAQHIQLVASWGFLPFGVMMVLFATVRANGAMIAPLIILSLTMGVLRLGLAYGLAPIYGTDAIWWSLAASSVASMAMAGWYYWRGGWRRAGMAAETAGAVAQARAEGVAG